MTQIDITIIDEFDDSTQESSGKLNLENGEVNNIVRKGKDNSKPWLSDDYEFTSGILKISNKEIEFAIHVSDDGDYEVSYAELKEIKEKMSNTVAKKQKMKM